MKTTLVDYPGLVAATVFTYGCNLRCPYCHNPELVTGPPPDDLLSQEEVLAFLGRRKAILQGVCLTGGEPLLHDWLPDFAGKIRQLGLKVKLDTNGLLPDRIAAVAADYVAMDIKTAPARYGQVGGAEHTADLVRRAVEVVRCTASDYEFRTTVVEPIVGEDDIRAIVTLLRPGERYTLSAFRPGKTLDPAFANAAGPTTRLLEHCAELAHAAGLNVHIREHHT